MNEWLGGELVGVPVKFLGRFPCLSDGVEHFLYSETLPSLASSNSLRAMKQWAFNDIFRAINLVYLDTFPRWMHTHTKTDPACKTWIKQNNRVDICTSWLIYNSTRLNSGDDSDCRKARLPLPLKIPRVASYLPSASAGNRTFGFAWIAAWLGAADGRSDADWRRCLGVGTAVRRGSRWKTLSRTPVTSRTRTADCWRSANHFFIKRVSKDVFRGRDRFKFNRKTASWLFWHVTHRKINFLQDTSQNYFSYNSFSARHFVTLFLNDKLSELNWQWMLKRGWKTDFLSV